ncbi:hypothetical protein B0H16DRAFT_1450049 [Mycena metata]|uniref:Uncharacterized protein n=1 Tax=Mycena metata TaxID=1033252 RepID=A0AAD7NU97_9AGAR|nr:hypothetical protein B0H16DRAFT_1450049 [Mycena metata]
MPVGCMLDVLMTSAAMFAPCVTSSISRSDNFEISAEISKLCCILHKRNESPNILVAASTLSGSEDLRYFPLPDKTLSWPTEWILTALEHLHRSIPHSPGGRRDCSISTTMAVHGLLQILALSDARTLQHQPSTEALSMIVTALPVMAPSSQIISHLAFLVFSRARTWYLGPNLRKIMQQVSVWAHLGCIVSEMEQSHHISHYQELGVYLANVSEWRPFIKSDIATWIIVGTGVKDWRGFVLPSGRFVSVIRSVWLPDFSPEHEKFVTLATEVWIFTVAALSRVWQTFEFSTPEFLRLARCTVSTALRVHHNRIPPAISSDLRRVFSRSLGESLIQAARRQLIY